MTSQVAHCHHHVDTDQGYCAQEQNYFIGSISSNQALLVVLYVLMGVLEEYEGQAHGTQDE